MQYSTYPPQLVEQTSVQSVKSEKEEKKDEQNQQIQKLSLQLKGEIGQKLISSIDFTQLQHIVLDNISNLVLKQTDISFDEKKIIENSLSLWIALVLHQTNLINDFYNFCNQFREKHDRSFIISGLTMKGNKKIREEFYTSFTIFSKINLEELQPFVYLSQELFNNMPENENKDNFSSNTQFFGLCTFLVNENLLSKEIDQVKMLGEVIDKVKKHQSREEKGSSKKD